MRMQTVQDEISVSIFTRPAAPGRRSNGGCPSIEEPQIAATTNLATSGAEGGGKPRRPRSDHRHHKGIARPFLLAYAGLRPTQGGILAMMQVSAGSQSCNSVNRLRILGKWMRMIIIPEQFSSTASWCAHGPIALTQSPSVGHNRRLREVAARPVRLEARDACRSRRSITFDRRTGRTRRLCPCVEPRKAGGRVQIVAGDIYDSSRATVRSGSNCDA